jgi:Domain of unknown function (DUF4157)
MITSEDVERNMPKAVQWVTQIEQTCMEIGRPLLPQNWRDGETIGIRELAAVRVMVLNEIPLPSDPELRQLAAQSKLVTPTTAGMTFGHGIVLKAGHYNRHLIAHELVHVMQYERFGGIEPFLVAYISEVLFPPYYPNGPLEQEAERLANTVCPIPA